MELVVDNTAKSLLLPDQAVTVLERVLTPYLKEGTDISTVIQQVEVEMVKEGSKQFTQFIMKKFF